MIGKVIARIRGGLGNQLFCYAAARRLALVNGVELVLDSESGFIRYRRYRRQYMLDHFTIPARKASWFERLHPFERYRRGGMKAWSRLWPFERRPYLEQEGIDFDQRLLDVRVRGTLYLDGLWQSERYFKDIEALLRKDLRIRPPLDVPNQAMAREIDLHLAVAMHVRWFDVPGSTGGDNVSSGYYPRAVAFLEQRLPSPHYYVFSDNPEAARARLAVPEGRSTFVSHNVGDEMAFADLWLMTRCRHFVTANSTFSWWSAWLGEAPDKIVVTPNHTAVGDAAWDFEGLILPAWQRL